MQGHRAQAIQAADTMAAAGAPLVEFLPEMADGMLSQTVFARVRTLDWIGFLRISSLQKNWSR